MVQTVLVRYMEHDGRDSMRLVEIHLSGPGNHNHLILSAALNDFRHHTQSV